MDATIAVRPGLRIDARHARTYLPPRSQFQPGSLAGLLRRCPRWRDRDEDRQPGRLRSVVLALRLLSGIGAWRVHLRDGDDVPTGGFLLVTVMGLCGYAHSLFPRLQFGSSGKVDRADHFSKHELTILGIHFILGIIYTARPALYRSQWQRMSCRSRDYNDP